MFVSMLNVLLYLFLLIMVLICDLVRIILFGDFELFSLLNMFLILLNVVLSLNVFIFFLMVSWVFIYFFVYKSFVILLAVEVLNWDSYWILLEILIFVVDSCWCFIGIFFLIWLIGKMIFIIEGVFYEFIIIFFKKLIIF